MTSIQIGHSSSFLAESTITGTSPEKSHMRILQRGFGSRTQHGVCSRSLQSNQTPNAPKYICMFCSRQMLRWNILTRVTYVCMWLVSLLQQLLIWGRTIMTSVVIHPSKKKFTFYGGNSKPIKIGVELGNQLIIVVNWLVSSSSPSWRRRWQRSWRGRWRGRGWSNSPGAVEPVQ